MRRLLLYLILLLWAPLVVYGANPDDTCTFAATGASSWGPIATVTGEGISCVGSTNAISDTDLFVIPTGAVVTVVEDIDFDATETGTGIQITGTGQLIIKASGESGNGRDQIEIKLPIGVGGGTQAISCASGGTLTAEGNYRQFKDATCTSAKPDRGDSADDDTYFTTGDVLMCPGDDPAGATATGTIDLDFFDNDPAPDTIVRGDATNWDAEGFLSGMKITITNSTSNNGTFIVQTAPASTTLTLRASAELTLEDDAGTADAAQVDEWFSDCAGDAAGTAGLLHVVGFHYEEGEWNENTATAGDSFIDECFAELAEGEDILGYPYLGPGSPADAPFMYEITNVEVATTVNNNLIHIDVRQGDETAATPGYALTRRQVLEGQIVNAVVRGDKCVQTTGGFITEGNASCAGSGDPIACCSGAGAGTCTPDWERGGQWIYFDADMDGYADPPYRINKTMEDEDCTGTAASGTDAIFIGDRRGFGEAHLASAIFWVVPPPFETGDPFYVYAPIRFSDQSASESDTVVSLSCATDWNAVSFDSIGSFNTNAGYSITASSRDVFIRDSGGGNTWGVDGGDQDWDHWVVTGGGSADANHGIVVGGDIVGVNLILQDVGFRYIGDDAFVGVASGSATKITTAALQYNDSNPDTISRVGETFVSKNYLADMQIVVTVSDSNDGTFTIASLTEEVLTLVATDELTTETSGTSTLDDVGTRFGSIDVARMRMQFGATGGGSQALFDGTGGSRHEGAFVMDDVECAGMHTGESCIDFSISPPNALSSNISGITLWGTESPIANDDGSMTFSEVIASGVLVAVGDVIPRGNRVNRSHIWDVTAGSLGEDLHDVILQDITSPTGVFLSIDDLDWQNVLFHNLITTTTGSAMVTINGPDAGESITLKRVTFVWDEGLNAGFSELFVQWNISADDAFLGGWLFDHFDGNGSATIIQGESEAESDEFIWDGNSICFYSLDPDVAILSDRVTVRDDTNWPGKAADGAWLTGRKAPFVDRANENFTLWPRSDAARLNCGIKSGAGAPGLTRKRWGHWINKIEPMDLGQLNAGNGLSMDQGGSGF